MFFIIHALDKPDHVQSRLDGYADHKAYLSSASIKTLVSGPLLADDGETMIGSFFLVEADKKADVIKFNANDPFAKIGLWQNVSIHQFNKRVDNRDMGTPA
ncbi:YciI family protein [Paraburkholderia sp. EG286A]|uniref:YciI family protein n=1 Tax=Paraburkholderia sp. EG286A TaxID=3237014 RepID=UPI0034D31485